MSSFSFSSWGRCLPLVSLLGAVPSGAAVTYSGVQSVAIPTDVGGVYVDLDSGASSSAEVAGWDLNFFFGGLGIGNSAGLQPVRSGTGNMDPLVALQMGTPVQSSSVFSSGDGGSGADDDSGHIGPGVGQFTEGQSGLLGFKVLRGVETFFGWMRVSLSRFDAVGLIQGWALEETAGKAIAAGDTGELGEDPWIIHTGQTSWAKSNVVGNDLVLRPDSDFTFEEGSSQGTYAGKVVGTGRLRVAGLGGLRLSGSNPFSGTLTVAPGSALYVEQNENVGSAAVLLQDQASLVFDGLPGNNGALNTYGNAIAVSDAATGFLRQWGTGVVRLSGPLSGTGTLRKTGSGTLVVGGAGSNGFSGLTVVDGGELLLQKTGGGQALGGDVTVNGGKLSLGASDQLGDGADVVVGPGGTLGFTGSGLRETIGTFTNNGGSFSTGANSLFGTGNSITWLAGSDNTVNNGGLLADGHLVISGGTNVVEGGALGGVLRLDAGGAGLEMSGGSTLTLNSDNAVAGKLLLLGNVSATGDTTVTIANGLGGANPGTIDLGGGVRTFTVGDGTDAPDMLISASLTQGGLVKAGLGSLVLNAGNPYAGSTAISGGTLELSGAAAALSATSLVSLDGGTLLLNGTGGNAVADGAGIQLGGSSSAWSTLQLSGGISETLGVLTLSGTAGFRVIDFGFGRGSLTFASLAGALGGGALQVWNWSGTFRSGGGMDQLIITGGLGSQLLLSDIRFFSDNGSTLLGEAGWLSGWSGELVPVPEAGSLGAALALLAPLAWRERRQWARCLEARVAAGLEKGQTASL